MPYDTRPSESQETFFDHRFVSRCISEHNPPYDVTYTAVLFPMHGPEKPILVAVPVDIRRDGSYGIDDLDVAYWIQPSAYQGNVIDLTSNRKFYEHYPCDGGQMPFNCTVYFEDQSNGQGLNRTLMAMGVDESWKGNIVVVKNLDEECNVNMNEQDIVHTTKLVTQILSLGLIPKRPLYYPPTHYY